MRRLMTLSVAALAVVFALSYAVPAIGGPTAFSSASPVKLAKKALKRAKKADKRAKRAQATANSVAAKVSKNGGVLAANVQTVSSAPISIASGTVSQGTVTCPAGTVVISGGFALTGTEASAIFDRRSGNGWSVGVDNLVVPGSPATLVVDAQCAGAANAVVARSSERADRSRDRRVLEAQRAAAKR
jgi:hypothetical protein